MIDLVFDHPQFVVINKAPGVSFHQEDGVPGVAELTRSQFNYPELFPVHRLDKVTSGLLLLAKDSTTARQLSDAFANHQVEKRYIALAAKAPKKKQGWIKGDMEKGRNGQWRLSHLTTNPALTWFISRGLGDGHRAFLLFPYSGKTHQLRVAMKSLGSPILGDELYSGAAADRTYLHAWQLAFRLNGEDFRFSQAPNVGQHFNHATLSEILAEWQDMPRPKP